MEGKKGTGCKDFLPRLLRSYRIYTNRIFRLQHADAEDPTAKDHTEGTTGKEAISSPDRKADCNFIPQGKLSVQYLNTARAAKKTTRGFQILHNALNFSRPHPHYTHTLT